jgi:microbial collagenase
VLLTAFAHNAAASDDGGHPAPPTGAIALKPIVHFKSAAPDSRPKPPSGARIPERYLDYDHTPETSSARFNDDGPAKLKHFARMAEVSLIPAAGDDRGTAAGAANSPDAAATCDTNAFANASSSTIGELVRTSDLNCLNTLFGVTGSTASAVFSESKMIAVANYAKSYAASYPGDDSTGVQQFALFLRTGYYVQFYNPSAIPTYSSNVTSGVDAYVDAFVANSHFYDVNDNHGIVLNEVLILTESSKQQARYVGAYINLLNQYNSGYNAYYNMIAAIDQVFVAIYNGAWIPAWVSLVDADTSIVGAVGNFVARTGFNANTSNEWLTRDAAGELAHFLDGSTYASNVVGAARPLVRSVIQTYNFTNNGVSIFIAAVSGQAYYDGANCSYYGTCSTKSQVLAAVQGQSYQCPNDAIKIVAQNMTAQQFSDTCATLHSEVAYIHGIFKDPGPVAGDNTAGLEIDVFNSSTDYATYGSYLYGISTNNGGISIEGDPSQVGNIAHFYCYHAEWITTDWEIWNLWHEFTHYMDSKYNQKGGFGDEPTMNANLPYSEVWWIEGIAEYVSYSYRNLVNSGAVTVAAKHAYSLPRLFNNTYDMASYQEAAYPGGYLAVYFMINNHRADIDTMLGIFRAGGYSTTYHTFLDGIRNSYTADFEAFETCFTNNNGTGGCAASTMPAASLSASSLTFASTNVGSTSGAQTVTLSNTGSAALSISSIAISGDYAQTNNCGTSLANGSSCGISVTFKPTASGTRTGTLTVSSNASNGAQTASLTGTGATSGGGGTSFSGTIAAQGGSAFTPNFTSGAGTVTATLTVPAGTSWRFVANDATANQAITEKNGAGPMTLTFTAVAGHSYNFYVQATTGSGAWSIAVSYPSNSSGNINYSGTIASQGASTFTSNFTSGAGTVSATLNVPAGTSWRFVADDATANQAITEKNGTGPLTLTFTAVAGHSYNFYVQASTGSGAWSITGSHP